MKHHLSGLICSCLLFAMCSHGLRAGDISDERSAAAFYHSQQYQEALDIWKKMVSQHSYAGIFFNIGLAQSKLGHPAEAIYAFEQASRLRPLKNEYAKAIELERKKLDNAVIPLSPFFLQRWYQGYITLLRPGWWSLMGLILLLLVIVIYLQSIGAWKGKPLLSRVSIRWLGIAGLFFLASALLSARHFYRTDEAVMMNSCELKQASTHESPTLRQLSAGEKIKIKDKVGDWYYVALLNLDYGWVKGDCFSIITLSGSR
jgi:tetratricopeptide (TPR) repeat protein